MAWGIVRRRLPAVVAVLGGAMGLSIILVVLSRTLDRSGVESDHRPARTPRVPGPAATAPDWVRWGDVQLGSRRLRGAEEAFDRAVRLDPTLAQARLRLVWIHSVQMRRSEVLAGFAALADLGPLSFDQVRLWSQVRCSLWDPEKTTAQLRRLLEADPGDRWVRLALGEGLRRQGRPAEALEVLGALGESDPGARMVRARLAIDRGDRSAAEALLADGPADHPEIAELRGRLALARGDGTGAVAAFRRGLDAQPDHRGCTAGLAQALRLCGRGREAEPWLARVRRQDALINLLRGAGEQTGPPDPKFLRSLGAACEALRFAPEARAWYGLALAREPLNTEVQIALHRLRHERPAPGP
jgi:tetratricopeptide (TPR) repeat protein